MSKNRREPRRTTENLEEPQRTSKNHRESRRTTENLEELQRTSKSHHDPELPRRTMSNPHDSSRAAENPEILHRFLVFKAPSTETQTVSRHKEPHRLSHVSSINPFAFQKNIFYLQFGKSRHCQEKLAYYWIPPETHLPTS